MSKPDWEPAEPLEIRKNFAFYPLANDGVGNHAAKKRRDRKKRLSTFGLDGLDEMILSSRDSVDEADVSAVKG